MRVDVRGLLTAGLAALLAGCSTYSGPLVGSIAADDGILFANLEDAGMYRSTDHGKTWAPLGDAGQKRSRITHLVNSGGALLGLTEKKSLVSTDAGRTWAEAGDLPAAARTYSLVGKGERFWVGTSDGLWRSTDRGRNWVSASHGVVRKHVSHIAACDSVVLVYAYDTQQSIAGDFASSAGTYRSTNFGETWSELDSLLTDFAVVGDAVFALGRNGAVVRSGDRGGHWRELPQEPATRDGFTSRFFQLVPCSGNLLAAGFAPTSDGRVLHSVFRSTDGGIHWAPVRIPGEFRWDWLKPLVASDDIVIINGGARAVLSNDGGTSWFEIEFRK